MWLKLKEPDHDAVLYNAKFREKCTMADLEVMTQPNTFTINFFFQFWIGVL